MLFPALVVSHPCDRKKAQGWGTEFWVTPIMVQLQTPVLPATGELMPPVEFHPDQEPIVL
jgi:hypothetical protein